MNANRLFKTDSNPLDRRVVSKLLHLCCASDSADSAAALLNGELGTLPLVNEFDDETGLSPLHTTAESHSKRCKTLPLTCFLRHGCVCGLDLWCGCGGFRSKMWVAVMGSDLWCGFGFDLGIRFVFVIWVFVGFDLNMCGYL